MSKVINAVQPQKGWKLLWSNSNTNADFAAGNIGYDATGCSELMFTFIRNKAPTGELAFIAPYIFDLGLYSGEAFIASAVIDSSGRNGRRIVKAITSTGCTIEKGEKYNSYGASSTQDNSLIVLTNIYGR